MLLHVPEVLTKEALERCRSAVASGQWVDGRITAGTQSEQVKRNLQLPEQSEASRAGSESARTSCPVVCGAASAVVQCR